MARTKTVIAKRTKTVIAKQKVVTKKYKEIKPRKIPLSLMRSLVEIYYDFQKQRIITSNRITMLKKRHAFKTEELDYFGVNDLMSDAELFENRIKLNLTKQLKYYPIHEDYLEKIYGIGPIISAGLLAYVDDIGKFANISKLWQMAGFGMNRFCKNCDGPTFVIVEYENKEKKKTKAKKLKPFDKCPDCGNETEPMIQRRMVGYQSNWNDKFKVLCWKIGNSFVKQSALKSGYRKLYDEFKAEEHRLHPVKEKRNGRTYYNDGHLHNRAMRKVVKIFLANLWETWRRQEKLKVTEAYAGKILSHDVIKPFTDK